MIRLKPGDILHIILGIEDFGDGQLPWIPCEEDLDECYNNFRKVIPESVEIIVTSIGVTPTVIQYDDVPKTVGVLQKSGSGRSFGKDTQEEFDLTSD